MNFTPEQDQAVTARGGALLVSAGAGSGKTRVLVERLVAYVTDPDAPQDVDRFLIITYTRAAAAELRERISARLGELAAKNPNDRHLRRQTALVSRARIGTIHSFCASLLREHAHLLGLAQDFRVADETRCLPLRETALARTMESAYERIEEDADFRALVDSVGAGRDDSRLEAVVLSLYQKMTSHPDPLAWAEGCAAAFELDGETDAGKTVWGKALLADAKRATALWARRLADTALLFSDDASLARAYGEAFSEAERLLLDFAEACGDSWDAAREALPTAFPRLKGPKQPYDAALAERAKAVWNACKKAVQTVSKRLVASSAQALADLRAVSGAARALVRLTADFAAAYDREKRRLSLLDYSDLEHRSLKLLLDENGAPSAAAEEVSRRFVEVMVDEYQDVNAVQDAVFGAVSRGGKNLFLVGDVKQSIYRFRLADPTIFLGRYDAWADGKDGARILLRENFRSRPEILEAVNFVFEAIMSRALGELDYDENAALRPGRTDWEKADGPLVRLTAVDPATDDEEDERSATQAEAAAVAARLRALYDAKTPVRDGDACRPMRWSDACVLLRSPGSIGAAFRAALELQRVPVQSEQGADLFSFDEVTVTLHLLALADNPRQDLPLVSVLRSALFGFTPDELAAVRAGARDASFYDALCLRAETDEKCRAFLALLAELRRDAQDMPPGAFLWRVYARTGALAVASALPGGAARRDNLLRLTALAQRFEENGWRGLGRFLRWLEELRESGAAPVEAPAGGDAVRLMSIHRSKGLEFPIVFLAGLGHRFNRRDVSETLPVDAVLGLGLKRSDLARGVEYPTIARTAVQGALTRQLLSEEMRVLYVAMTRAKERLYMSCAMKDPAKKLEKLALGLSAPLDPGELEAASSPADWLLRAALLPGSPLRPEIVPAPTAPAPASSAPVGVDGPDRLLLPLRGNSPSPLIDPPSAIPDPARRADEGVRPYGQAESPAPLDLAPVLDFRYPYAAAQDMPAKLTATELKDRFAEPDAEAASLLPAAPETFRAPDFGGEKQPLRGAARGTATHRFLQYADLAAAARPEGVAAEKARLAARGTLLPEEAEAVDEDAVAWFLATGPGRLAARASETASPPAPVGVDGPDRLLLPLRGNSPSPLIDPPSAGPDPARRADEGVRPYGQAESPAPASTPCHSERSEESRSEILRLAALAQDDKASAPALRRELRFSLLVRAEDFRPGAGDDEILLQGIVDCCVFEPDGVTILDYKTDRVAGAALEERAKHYAPQLRAYVRALARMTGSPVKRCVLVFLHARETRDVEF